MKRVSFLPLALIALALSGCKKKPAPAPTDEAPTVFDDPVAAPKPQVLPGRCRQEAELSAGGPFELGEYASLGGKTLVAIASGAGPNRVAKLLTLDESGAMLSARELGKLDGDAPPPVLSLQGNAWALAYFKRGARRESEVIVERSGKTESTVLPQQNDETYGMSIAIRGDDVVVVYDEDIPHSSLGRVNAAHIRGGAVVRTTPLSDSERDADAPQIVATHTGFAVAWVERRTLGFKDASPTRLEAPGQVPAFEWLEAAALDEHGQLTSRPFDLTPRSGHTRAFSMAAAEQPMLAIRNDDGVKGAGRLQFAALSGDRSLSLIASEAVGRSVPALIATEGTNWLVQSSNDADQPVLWWKSGTDWNGFREEILGQGRAIRVLSSRRILVAYGERGVFLRFACE